MPYKHKYAADDVTTWKDRYCLILRYFFLTNKEASVHHADTSDKKAVILADSRITMGLYYAANVNRKWLLENDSELKNREVKESNKFL